MMNWIVFNPQCDLGFLPDLISDNDPRPVKDQLNDTYRHGGGWNPQSQFTLDRSNRNTLKYPGDPPMRPLAMSQCRDEILLFYPYAYLCILQLDGSFEVARVD
jgi:hypothetical protein